MPAAALLIVLGGALGFYLYARSRAQLPPLYADQVSGFDPGPRADNAPDYFPGVAMGAGGGELGVLDRMTETVRRVFDPPMTAAPYIERIRAAEQRHGLPESLLARVLYQESRFRPDIITGRTRSPAGAVGIAQFMPATARELGVDPLNPSSAIDGAARYLRRLYDAAGSWPAALAAYNWGIGNVQRRGLEDAPAETREYVASIAKDVTL